MSSLQFLEKLGLRSKYEVIIWNFIQTAISEAVNLFQTQIVQPQTDLASSAPFNGQRLGDLFIQAISGKTPAEVINVTVLKKKRLTSPALSFR